MFVTNTDWEFADVASVTAAGEADMARDESGGCDQASQRFKRVRPPGRTIVVIWPDAATAQAAIDDVRAKGNGVG